MNTASPELGQELYDLSEWVDTTHHKENGRLAFDYSLGYLLRKLPKYTHVWITVAGAEAECYYPKQKTATVHGDTPENALCQLAIELFKQEILKP